MKLALFSIVLLIMSCPGQDSNQASNRAQQVSLDRVFELKVGQEAIIKAERLKAKFVSVLEDSRCPKGVQCIQAGKGRISLQLTSGNNKPQNVELSTDEAEQQLDFNGYQVKLISLNPYPKMERVLKPADYVLSLNISKGNSSGNSKTSSSF
jgi:hypothetical protein